MAFTTWDPGQCGCGCGGVPCKLPATDLTLTHVHATYGTHAGTLVYGGAGPCTWTLCLAIGANEWLQFSIDGTNPACTYYEVQYHTSAGPCNDPFASVAYTDEPVGCSTGALGMTLVSHSCAPLNIVFRTGAGPLPTYTITP